MLKIKQHQAINREFDKKYLALVATDQFQKSSADAKLLILQEFQNQYDQACELTDKG